MTREEKLNTSPPCEPTGSLPRLVNDNLLWTGGCLTIDYKGEATHGHFSLFVIRGSRKTMMIDTGHAIHWREAAQHVADFLGDRPLDYVFMTHGEFPHAGLMPHWLNKYPDAIAIGALPEYPLYYPDLADRMQMVKAGDTIDLGDRVIEFVPSIWRDLPTLWAFDHKDRVLFGSDGFAFLHYHKAGQCDFLTSEAPKPDVELIQFFNERALRWTRYTDARVTFADLEDMLQRLKPALIAPAHGGVIDTVDEMMPLIRGGMLMGASGEAAQIGRAPTK